MAKLQHSISRSTRMQYELDSDLLYHTTDSVVKLFMNVYLRQSIVVDRLQ